MFPFFASLILLGEIYNNRQVRLAIAFISAAVVVISSAYLRDVRFDSLDDLHSYWTYLEMFSNTGDLNFFSDGEFIFRWVIAAGSFLGISDIRIFLLFCLAIEVLLLAKALLKYGNRGTFVFLLIIFSAPFIVHGSQFIRQLIGFLFLVNAFSESGRIRWVYFVAGVCTHLSCLLFLPLLSRKFNSLFSKYGYFFIAFAFFSPGLNVSTILDFFSDGLFSDKFEIWKYYTDDEASPTVFIFFYMTVVFIFVRDNVLHMRPSSPIHTEASINTLTTLRSFVLYSVFIGLLFSFLPVGAMRFGLAGIVFSPLLLLDDEKRSSNRYKILILVFALIYLTAGWARIMIKPGDVFEGKFQCIPFSLCSNALH